MLELPIFKPLSQTAKSCLIFLYAYKFYNNFCLGFVFLGRTANPYQEPKAKPGSFNRLSVFHLSSSTHIFNQFFGGTLQLNKTGLPELFIYLKKINQARAREAFSPNEA